MGERTPKATGGLPESFGPFAVVKRGSCGWRPVPASDLVPWDEVHGIARFDRWDDAEAASAAAWLAEAVVGS